MMLELKEKVFARLNELGLDEVQARLDRGERLGDPQLVREWLELRRSDPGCLGHERSPAPVARD